MLAKWMNFPLSRGTCCLHESLSDSAQASSQAHTHLEGENPHKRENS